MFGCLCGSARSPGSWCVRRVWPCVLFWLARGRLPHGCCFNCLRPPACIDWPCLPCLPCRPCLLAVASLPRYHSQMPRVGLSRLGLLQPRPWDCHACSRKHQRANSPRIKRRKRVQHTTGSGAESQPPEILQISKSILKKNTNKFTLALWELGRADLCLRRRERIVKTTRSRTSCPSN